MMLDSRLMGAFIISWIILTTIALIYFNGLRSAKSVIQIAINFILAFIPPLGLVYFAMLSLGFRKQTT
ncbi:hypothetical protein [Alteromonas macleodii]|uniref:hypothetical protein n=1 Tax=Alteromonas macleodii TaxID=28108 RepID=UPI003BF8BD86